MPLPIESSLPQIIDALKQKRRLILSAAPGTGKTTCVPPALLDITPKQIILVEPRRIAAKAAAARISSILNDRTGGIAGYQVRGDSAISKSTRIIAVTPGVMLKILQSDPLLENIGAVIFDEFHERQWECDLALTFIDDIERSAGTGLYITVMSATADTEKLSAYLSGSTTLHIPGKLHPVEILWSDNPPDIRNIALNTAKAILRMKNQSQGDMLVFLPGAGEINSVNQMISSSIDDSNEIIMPLYGDLPLERQLAVLAPEPHQRRKIILATNVAESSITIDGVTVVIDSGFERKLEYDPAAGISFLKLAKITRASAEQRSGRAGRTAPGIALRLWNKLDHASRSEHTVPDILCAELSPLLLEVFSWGGSIDSLHWLDAPPAASIAEATELLFRLGAIDRNHHLTETGRKIAGLPLHPRLGAMLLRAERLGALSAAMDLAIILEDRIHSNTGSADIALLHPSRDAKHLLSILKREFSPSGNPENRDISSGVLLAGAFPDWIAQKTADRRYRLAGGRAARLLPGDDLEQHDFLAVGRMSGNGSNDNIIRIAAPLKKSELEYYWQNDIATHREVNFNPENRKASIRITRRMGELILDEKIAQDASREELCEAVINAATEHNLTIPPKTNTAACRFLDRVRFAHHTAPDSYPDWNPQKWDCLWKTLAENFPVRSFADLENIPWLDLMRAEIGYEILQKLDREFPTVFKPPRGSEIKINYSQDIPVLPVRIQALYTLNVHPVIGPRKLPLKLELLSPASRPVQITSDLPGFWRGSWSIVRKEMKSRYPKHLWPEDPLNPDA